MKTTTTLLLAPALLLDSTCTAIAVVVLAGGMRGLVAFPSRLLLWRTRRGGSSPCSSASR